MNFGEFGDRFWGLRIYLRYYWVVCVLVIVTVRVWL